MLLVTFVIIIRNCYWNYYIPIILLLYIHVDIIVGTFLKFILHTRTYTYTNTQLLSSKNKQDPGTEPHPPFDPLPSVIIRFRIWFFNFRIRRRKWSVASNSNQVYESDSLINSNNKSVVSLFYILFIIYYYYYYIIINFTHMDHIARCTLLYVIAINL